MIAKLRAILKPSNRSLVRELVASDFKLRYQNSVLGYLWSLLRPLMLFGILFVIFTRAFPQASAGVEHYPAYLLLGLVMWTFFVEATVAGMNAITGRGDMVRKVSIPKYTIVFGTTLTAFVTFLLNMVVVLVVMLISGVPFRWTILLVPFVLAEFVMLCLALSFLMSALYVKLRDLGHIWDVVLQVMFYATPLIYVLGNMPERFAFYASFNPLAQIIQDVRSFMITSTTLTTKEVFGSQWGRFGHVLFVLALLVVAALYFKKHSKNFAEEL